MHSKRFFPFILRWAVHPYRLPLKMGLKLATELSMRFGRIVQNMHSSYLASENFYKNRSSPSAFPFTDNLKKYPHSIDGCSVPQIHDIAPPLQKQLKYL